MARIIKTATAISFLVAIITLITHYSGKDSEAVEATHETQYPTPGSRTNTHLSDTNREPDKHPQTERSRPPNSQAGSNQHPRIADIVTAFRDLSSRFSGPELDQQRLILLNKFVPHLSQADLFSLADQIKSDYDEKNINLLAQTCMYAFNHDWPPDHPDAIRLARWISNQENPVFLESLVESLGVHTNSLDQNHLRTYFDALPNVRSRDHYAASLIRSRSKGRLSQPHPDIAYIASVGSGPKVSDAIAAMEFPDSFDFESLLSEIWHNREDPETEDPPEPLVTATVAQKWIEAQPEAVASALSTSDGDTINLALERLVEVNFPAAQSALRNLSNSEQTTSQAESVLAYIGASNPEAAWEMLADLPTEEARLRVAESVYLKWAPIDKSAADQAWDSLFDE